MGLPADLLSRPRREAARLLALEQLRAFRKAALRLDDAADLEALHAFRVAGRRMLSIARAWKRELRGLVHKKDRRALSELQSSTGEGRDAEVTLAWLAKQREHLSELQRPGLDWLVESLRERLDQTMVAASENLRTSHRALDERLGAALCDASRDRDKPGRFGKTLLRSVRRHRKGLRVLLAGIESTGDRESLHRVRIAVKRLRYLVEPVRPHAAAATSVVRSCMQLQELLGEINDTCLQQAALLARIEEFEGRSASVALLPGLQELSRLEAERLASLHGILREDWLADGLERLSGLVQTLLEELHASA